MINKTPSFQIHGAPLPLEHSFRALTFRKREVRRGISVHVFTWPPCPRVVDPSSTILRKTLRDTEPPHKADQWRAELSRNNQDILEMTFAVQSPFFCLVESWVAPGLQSSGTAGENLIEPRKSIHSFLKLA